MINDYIILVIFKNNFAPNFNISPLFCIHIHHRKILIEKDFKKFFPALIWSFHQNNGIRKNIYYFFQ
ncbi:hypothetical protein CK621_14250 [Vandammella animalimorsus]|uniref:Uncharacterized protein n=1 Tax=Vandammella animalimorsus TaxID=2029117 RepID=A0A2A2AQQ6_9BURK|nr:hypothetical protein CK621_14250 [Vandammella animalimorsus]